MDFEKIREIKELVISGIYSDDYLLDKLVMKGANVLDLIYNVSPRASMDIDFSIEQSLSGDEFKKLNSSLEEALRTSFSNKGYYLFDYKFSKRPKKAKSNQPEFWGGYKVVFKIIPKSELDKTGSDLNRLRREATIVNSEQKRTFSIDISKCEWVLGKEKHMLDGLVISTYSPTMLLCEKIRAICQQMSEYSEFVPNPTRSARARDFFDIYNICHNFKIDISSIEFRTQLKSIFAAKKVPLSLTNHIEAYREFHRPDFQRVVDTVKPGIVIQDYDAYFDFVSDLFEQLKTPGIK